MSDEAERQQTPDSSDVSTVIRCLDEFDNDMFTGINGSFDLSCDVKVSTDCQNGVKTNKSADIPDQIYDFSYPFEFVTKDFGTFHQLDDNDVSEEFHAINNDRFGQIPAKDKNEQQIDDSYSISLRKGNLNTAKNLNLLTSIQKQVTKPRDQFRRKHSTPQHFDRRKSFPLSSDSRLAQSPPQSQATSMHLMHNFPSQFETMQYDKLEGFNDTSYPFEHANAYCSKPYAVPMKSARKRALNDDQSNNSIERSIPFFPSQVGPTSTSGIQSSPSTIIAQKRQLQIQHKEQEKRKRMMLIIQQEHDLLEQRHQRVIKQHQQEWAKHKIQLDQQQQQHQQLQQHQQQQRLTHQEQQQLLLQMQRKQKQKLQQHMLLQQLKMEQQNHSEAIGDQNVQRCQMYHASLTNEWHKLNQSRRNSSRQREQKLLLRHVLEATSNETSSIIDLTHDVKINPNLHNREFMKVPGTQSRYIRKSVDGLANSTALIEQHKQLLKQQLAVQKQKHGPRVSQPSIITINSQKDVDDDVSTLGADDDSVTGGHDTK